jgi:CheY-like chemotaxis protein
VVIIIISGIGHVSGGGGINTMAHILILQEEPAWQAALQRSLKKHHHVLAVNSVQAALNALHERNFDLIISRVHLERNDMFGFLRTVKNDPSLKGLPFICFCGRRTQLSIALDDVLSLSSRTIGADKYISINNYSFGDDCDLDGIRNAIESCLLQRH